MTTKKERREKKLKTRENKREKKRENERENEEKKSRLEKSRPKKSDLYRPAPPSFADVLFYWDLDDEDEEGNELLAVTLKPLTVAARMFILDRQPIAGLHPDDPGNLLDNPDRRPRRRTVGPGTLSVSHRKGARPKRSRTRSSSRSRTARRERKATTAGSARKAESPPRKQRRL